MKAAQFHAKEDLRIEEVPEPTPGPGQVKLRNAFAGICGSDLHVYYSPGAAGLDFDHPHPVTGSTLPQILGHEFSGTIVELGEDVEDVAVGDRVAVWPIYYCGECPACRRGMFNACQKVGFHGLSSHGGGMAEFTTVDAAKLHVLPENVDLRMGALVEPMSVAWHAVSRSGVDAGGTALIAGAGPIGIGVWFALKARGIDKVLVSEPSAERRSIIAALGATVVDPVNDDLAAAVATLTDGEGVDVAFDAAGAGPAVTSSLASLVPGGRVVVVAIHERPMEFLPTQLVMAETEIAGALAYLPEDFDAVIEAMSRGVYDTTGWVQEVPLEQVVDAIHSLRGGAGAKILVQAD
ncbi:2,3-butanediol dehydrogenase [Microbacterium foliorum]|uniref:2,3-butanediol dehydrogenase n=1 Tax=Microbacterium foliorum TaxID=104336 RepID=UPI001D2B6AC0|nr:2,3-butanediol dehydrogenase [Microbacterium foliorum]CAH0140874.1 D-arabitol-phosphate dehydrogenase [Microbacterium foliorum]CAH0161138.1 D-arabitol-phosphate dehydrogenase [Microbacterium foliorum]